MGSVGKAESVYLSSVRVPEVMASSAAARGGLQSNDLILKVGWRGWARARSGWRDVAGGGAGAGASVGAGAGCGLNSTPCTLHLHVACSLPSAPACSPHPEPYPPYLHVTYSLPSPLSLPLHQVGS